MADELQKKLTPLRERIDAIDAQLLELLSERARTAQAVGAAKEDHAGVVLRPEREAQVIRRLQELNGGPLPASALAAIWGEIMSACRGLEQRPRVAYLGPQGTYSEQAVLAHFGHAVDADSCGTIDEVFRSVETRRADFGIVPLENSNEGAVNRTLDLLLTSSAKVIGERSVPVVQCLMTRSGTLDGVTIVRSHPQSLAQCQGWLSDHHPGLARASAASNAEAARLAAEDPTVAAIAGEQAAQRWGLKIVAAGIQDDPHNRTRFFAIGHIDNAPSGRDKTSLILAVPNEAGAVYRMLAPLAENGVSMTRLESRPARTGQWEYYFYVDIEGHWQDPAVAAALAALKARVAFIKVLGSYPVTS
ncbi:P-protein [Pigmentiphaga humi]|uniref:Bifunctional chorismate mutase/prephenate dehydratase n=1 Tax=Pigmentiphaga humi TaxID=2478468 RepID=A0A3P4AZ25_9BURK|nr:prephenate dehydratase [Pigmentiphaga humi]VCU69012.1 P-protein [Pigmentiphaga humi]